MTIPAPPAGTVHLNRYHHFTQLMRDARVDCAVSRYTSTFDSTRQSVMVLRPTKRHSGELFVFFHGMDGDCGDAVVARELTSELGAVVVAPGGRGPAWVSDAFMVDAGQIIRKHARDSEKVYLIGISMGGTQALTLASGMAGTLGRKLAGVIAFIPGADLVDSAVHSSNARVRDTLTQSVAGDVGTLRDRSPISLIDKYPSGLPFVLAYNDADTILPVASTVRLGESLAARGLPVVLYVIPGNHSFVTERLDERIDYRQVLADLGTASKPARPVPTRTPASAATPQLTVAA